MMLVYRGQSYSFTFIQYCSLSHIIIMCDVWTDVTDVMGCVLKPIDKRECPSQGLYTASCVPSTSGGIVVLN